MAEVDGIGETCRHHIDAYASWVWDKIPAKHHQEWLRKVQDLAMGRSAKRKLLIVAPPGHAKSTYLSQIFPCWYLGNFPDHAILSFTSSDIMAAQYGNVVKQCLEENPRHVQVFPSGRCRPSEKRGWSSTGLYLQGASASQKDPAYRSLGFGASAIGSRANGIIMDDPLTQEKSQSEVEQVRAKQYHDMTVDSRLHPDIGWEIAIMTRWHENDLVSHLMEKSDWDQVEMPAIGYWADEGAALWPERFSVEWLEAKREDIGSAMFACLYMGNPSAMGGGIFKADWWRHEAVTDDKKGILYQFWDTAFGKKDTNDYSVCTTWRVEQNAYRLLHVYRARIEFPELKRKATELYEEWRPRSLVVEDVGSGRILIQELRNETRLPILTYKPTRDKISRAHAVTPLIESGKVILPKKAPWLNCYLDEMASFPNGRHDDQVDSTTMALACMAIYGARSRQRGQMVDFRFVA